MDRSTSILDISKASHLKLMDFVHDIRKFYTPIKFVSPSFPHREGTPHWNSPYPRDFHSPYPILTPPLREALR